MAVVRCDHFSGKCKQAEETLWTLDLEELPDFRKRTGELFSDNSYLSTVLDRQGLQFAAPIDLRTKKVESFSPQLLQGFWHKLKKKNPKIFVMSPTVETKSIKKKWYGNSTNCVWSWQSTKSLAENTSLFWDQSQERFGG